MIIGDGFHHSAVCAVGVEKLAADETPADRDHVRAADAADNTERYADVAAVCRRQGDRHVDALPAVQRRPFTNEYPAATDALSPHASAPELERISQHLDGRLRAK